KPPAGLDAGDSAGGGGLDHAEHDLAVVEEEAVARGERRQDLGMGHADALLIAEPWIEVDDEGVAVLELDAAAGEDADPQLGPLQVGEDADRPPDIGFDLADDGDQLPQIIVARMAHVDAEEIRTGAVELGDRGLVGGGGAEGGENLDAARAAH